MIDDLFIIKRNGKREPFSMEKIRNAVTKAFVANGSFPSQEAMTNILGRLDIYDGISVEDIQNQVEKALMAERYYEVAKGYILYRQKHYEDREVKEKVEAMKARQAEIPATQEEAIPPHTIEDMPADTETGEIFNEPEEQ